MADEAAVMRGPDTFVGALADDTAASSQPARNTSPAEPSVSRESECVPAYRDGRGETAPSSAQGEAGPRGMVPRTPVPTLSVFQLLLGPTAGSCFVF